MRVEPTLHCLHVSGKEDIDVTSIVEIRYGFLTQVMLSYADALCAPQQAFSIVYQSTSAAGTTAVNLFCDTSERGALWAHYLTVMSSACSAFCSQGEVYCLASPFLAQIKGASPTVSVRTATSIIQDDLQLKVAPAQIKARVKTDELCFRDFVQVCRSLRTYEPLEKLFETYAKAPFLNMVSELVSFVLPSYRPLCAERAAYQSRAIDGVVQSRTAAAAE